MPILADTWMEMELIASPVPGLMLADTTRPISLLDVCIRTIIISASRVPTRDTV
jgi:hypothetical protein